MPLIGTSGWSYREWTNLLYPPGTRAGEYLRVYAARFGAVEINNSFYRIPAPQHLRRWAGMTPDGFVFAVKAWRGISHAGDIDAAGMASFFTALEALGDKCGPILLQLPPGRPLDTAWLDGLLKALPRAYDYVFELRNRTWLCDAVYDRLRAAGAANCFYDFKGFSNPEISTSGMLYLRLHGPLRQPYKGRYPPERLTRIANLLAAHDGPSFCFFDNTMDGAALADAQSLLDDLASARPKLAA